MNIVRVVLFVTRHLLWKSISHAEHIYQQLIPFQAVMHIEFSCVFRELISLFIAKTYIFHKKKNLVAVEKTNMID